MKRNMRRSRRLRGRRIQRGGLPIPPGSLVSTQQDPYSPTMIMDLETVLDTEKEPIRF
jgi:hypothetical protein